MGISKIATQSGREAGVLVGTNSLCRSPMWNIDWGLWQEPMCTSQWQLGTVTWGKGTSIWGAMTTLLSDVIYWSCSYDWRVQHDLDTWDTHVSQLISKTHSNGDGSDQKHSIIKWKWLLQDRAGGSFPLGLTLEPSELLLGSNVTWIVPIDSSQLTDKELLGLWTAIPKWMDNVPSGRPPFWSTW